MIKSSEPLFTVTEGWQGHCVHWFVIWRKHESEGLGEFFTEREAQTFVKFARERLDIPDLHIAPAPATPPSKSFADRFVEQGEELRMLMVGEDENFAVNCFDEWSEPTLAALQ